jgi:hypothetical protein
MSASKKDSCAHDMPFLAAAPLLEEKDPVERIR